MWEQGLLPQRRIRITLPSYFLSPPPLPGCCHTLHGSCHLPLPFVVAFLISSTGLWFCLRERAGRVFHGLCKPSACWCPTVTPGWVSQPCHVTCLIPQPAAMPGTQGKLLTIPLHSAHAWPSFCSHPSSHLPSENCILCHLSFNTHSHLCVNRAGTRSVVCLNNPAGNTGLGTRLPGFKP